MANSEFVIDGVLVELEQTSRKDQANGYAGLDAGGMIDPSELPAGVYVDSLAKSGAGGLTGDVTLSEGSGVTLTQAGNDIEIAASGGGGVDSLAKSGDTQLTGDVTLSAGSGITLTEAGQDIQIAASGGGALGGCAVYRTAVTAAIPTVTITPIPFDNEEFDDSGYHSNATNPSRFTIPATGVYLVTGSAQWDSNTGGGRGLWVQLNGTDTPTNRKGGTFHAGLNGSDMEDISLILALTSGDYIELCAFQSSGANRTIIVTSTRPRFAIYRLA